jgi:hypothetical protein
MPADNLLAGKLILPFEGKAACHCVVQRRYLPWKSFRRSRTQLRDRPETVQLHPGTGVHLHPGTPFGIIPESRSPCPGFPSYICGPLRSSLCRPQFLNHQLRFQSGLQIYVLKQDFPQLPELALACEGLAVQDSVDLVADGGTIHSFSDLRYMADAPLHG